MGKLLKGWSCQYQKLYYGESLLGVVGAPVVVLLGAVGGSVVVVPLVRQAFFGQIQLGLPDSSLNMLSSMWPRWMFPLFARPAQP